MAGKGTQTAAASWKQVQRPEDNISQSAQFWGKIWADRGAEERKRNDERAKQKADDLSTWEDEYGINPDDFLTDKTGFSDFDEYHRDYAMYAVDEYNKYYREGLDARERGDKRGIQEAEMKMAKIKNNFKLIAQSEDFYKKKYETYTKDVIDGNVSPVSRDYTDRVEAELENGRTKIRHDKNLNPVNITWDEDGNPMKPQSYSERMKDMRYVKPTKLEGDDGLIADISNVLGTISKDRASGYWNITEQKWDDEIHGKAVDSYIGMKLGDDDVMADLLWKATNGKTVKTEGFTEDEYKTVADYLKQQVKASYSEEYSQRFNTGKYSSDTRPTKTKDEDKYGARKWSINQVRDNDDVSFFSSGDFEWNGLEYEASNSQMVGDNIIITTTDGEKIVINKYSETAVNDLFNAFEGETLEFDKVQNTKALQWRDPRQGTQSGVTDVLSGQYDSSGTFIGDEDKVVSQLKKLYPDAKIERANWTAGNVIRINGKTINLDTTNKQGVERQIGNALGKAPSGSYQAQSSAKSR